MSFSDDDDNPFASNPNKHSFDLNSKIMLTAIISLSTIVILVVVLHIYARCVLRRQAHRRSAIRLQLGLDLLSREVNSSEPPKTGLDPMVIASLPIYIYKHNINGTGTECAVCLSMLEEEEMARLLPNCKHIFHAECIDKWLSSQSTCPICRTEAQPQLQPENREPVTGFPSTAPPLELHVNNSSMMGMEGTSDTAVLSAKVNGGSSSRLSSFRRMLSRERSSRRMNQTCSQEDGVEDLERQ